MNDLDKIENLVQLFEQAVDRFADNKLFGLFNDGRTGLDWMTYKEIGARVDNLRAGLVQSGIGKDDAVGFIGNNRPEWAITAFAAYGAGGRFVPMYEAELLSTWEYIIQDSSVKLLVVSKPEIYQTIRHFLETIPTLEKIVVIESDADNSLSALENMGRKHPAASIQPASGDIATLVYTSGTTGEPKGVLLSHGNLVSNAVSGHRLFASHLEASSRSISILPWAHSFGQVAELYNWFLFGGSIGFMESVQTLGEDLQLIRPTFIIAVPRVFNKIYDGMWAAMREKGGLALTLFQFGVDNARKKRELANQGHTDFKTNLKVWLADKVVFKKIRKKFGNRLIGSLTGSALMNVDIANFFADIGIPIFDCYGLSETSPAVTMNSFAASKPGSVGRPIDDVTVVINQSVALAGSDEGEIVVYGPNVMQGYHNKPEATQATMTEDGGFKTGDLGRLDEDGFLFITGRIKEQYKLENGKYVFPGSIEEDIRLLPLVANAMMYGEGKPYNICLVTPDYEVLEKFARANGINAPQEKLIDEPFVKETIESEIKASLKTKYGSYEIPKKFIYAAEDFTLDNGMLTQTMKLKRRVVIENYEQEIQAQYK